ncbi:MAG: VanZ family protein [Geminicoccaceae bacterium]
MNPRFRIVSCLVWCLSWPAIAVALLTPLPFGFISRSDLLGHLLLFTVMTVTIVAFARTRTQIVVLALLSIAYGIALEFGQAYVPNRTFDAADAIANALGGIAGCLIAIVLLDRLVNKGARTQPPTTPASRSSGV